MNERSDVHCKPHIHTKKVSPAHTCTHISEKIPHLFAQKLPHSRANSLQLRRQKYGSSKEDEPMNYVEQTKTLVQTLVHFFQVQDKRDKLDSNRSRKKVFD